MSDTKKYNVTYSNNNLHQHLRRIVANLEALFRKLGDLSEFIGEVDLDLTKKGCDININYVYLIGKNASHGFFICFDEIDRIEGMEHNLRTVLLRYLETKQGDLLELAKRVKDVYAQNTADVY